MELYHIQYTSKCTVPLSEIKLLRLQLKFKIKNYQSDITGLLVYNDGIFFQILEGDKSVVETLYKRISLDKRHTNIVKIFESPLANRIFSKWSLAFINRETPHDDSQTELS